MKRASDYKIVARQRIFNKYGTLAAATAIYGAIIVGIIFVISIIYAMNLMTKGVLNSVEAMQAYMDETATSYTYSLIYEAGAVLIGAVMCPLSVGIKYLCLKTARGQEIKLSDMLYAVRNYPDKVIIIYIIQQLLMFLFSIPANVIAVIANRNLTPIVWEALYYVFLIFSYIADLIIISLLSQAMFIYIDNPMENSLTCIETSISVMKKNIRSYIRLLISFIPAYIMAALTFGIGYIWVIPYQDTTFSLFYMQLKGELGSTIDVTVE